MARSPAHIRRIFRKLPHYKQFFLLLFKRQNPVVFQEYNALLRSYAGFFVKLFHIRFGRFRAIKLINEIENPFQSPVNGLFLHPSVSHGFKKLPAVYTVRSQFYIHHAAVVGFDLITVNRSEIRDDNTFVSEAFSQKIRDVLI